MVGKSLLRQVWRNTPWRVRHCALELLPWRFMRYLNILVTSRCNLRCKFCNIGLKSERQRNNDDPLTVEKFRKNLFSGRRFETAVQVHLSGGEPFLRGDLIELCDLFAMHCPNASLSIATNGTLTERILEFCKNISSRPYNNRVGLGISLDGIGSLHDNVRGVKGTYNRVTESISKLREHFPGVLKSIGFTIVPENIGDLQLVSELAKENELLFLYRMAAESPVYYGDNRGCLTPWKLSDLDELDRIVRSLSGPDEVASNSNIFNSLFFRNVVQANRSRKRSYPCFGGLSSVFIDHEGNIRPCIWLDCLLGNIAHDSLPDVLRSAQAREIRKYISRRECFCWTECETLTSWSSAEWLGMPIYEYLRVYDEE